MNEYKLPDIKRTVIEPEIIKGFKTEDDFTGLSVSILIEVGSYVCVAGNVYPIETKAWDLNQAIVGGHLIRLYKLISAMLDQTCQRRRETLFAFCRLVFECVINLRYLIKHASDELFKSYRAYSLKREYKLHREISENIEERGGKVLEIERRMLNSIESSFQVSGISIDEIELFNLRNWGGKNIFEKAKDLDLETVYLVAFGVGSHPIHGNWQDLLEYHLEEIENGYFKANFDWHQPRPQLLNAIALHSTEAVIEYINWITKGNAVELENELVNLQERIITLDILHEEFLSSYKKKS